MAWGFEATCEDCGHTWGGVEARCRIGPDSALSAANTRNVFCPRCYLRLYFPKTVDRPTGQAWFYAFPASSQAQSKFLRGVAARVRAALAGGSERVSVASALEGLQCPQCRGPMEPGSDTGERLVCPHCGRHSGVVSDYDSHLQLFADPEGWA
jgi:hypothetical protein